VTAAAPAIAEPTDTAAETRATGDFGRRLAHRVAARTATRRHTGGARSIGIVSRSAVGFGQAIGRSRQTRPNVTADSLTSLRLRPPVGWWHTLDTADSVAPVWQHDAWTDDLVPPTRHSPRRPAPARDPEVARRAAPVPAARPEPRPEPAVAPTGLGRLDALRNMIAGGLAPDGSAVSPDILHQQRPDDDVPAEQVAPSTPRRRPTPVAPTDPAGGPTTRQAHTEAGPATGPGSLGRRMQPELVEPGARQAQPEPGRGDQAASASTSPSRREVPRAGASTAPPNAPSAPREAAGVRRSPAWPTDAATPPQRDEVAGRVTSRPGAATPGTRPTPSAPGTPIARATDPTATPRTAGAPDRAGFAAPGVPGDHSGRDPVAGAKPAPEQRSSTAALVTPAVGEPVGRQPRSTSDTPTAPPPVRAPRLDTGAARPLDDRHPQQLARSLDGDHPPSAPRPLGGDDPSSIRGSADTHSSTRSLSRSLPPRPATTSGFDGLNHLGGDRPSAEAPTRRLGDHNPELGVADLRVQRLIAADPTHRPAPPAAAPARAVAVAEATAVPSTPRASRHRALVPQLPGSALDGQPLRRVTLPRAMSSVHRPSTSLVARTVAPASTPALLAAASTAPLAMATTVAALGRAEAGSVVAANLPTAAGARPAPADVRPPAGVVDLADEFVRPTTEVPAERVSVRRAPSAAGSSPAAVPAVLAGPTAPLRRRSLVATGADVLRRALAERPQPHRQPGAASRATPVRADLPVAPATRAARDASAPTPGPTTEFAVQPVAEPASEFEPAATDAARAPQRDTGTVRRAPSDVTHAAGTPRSEAGAALAERFMTELSQAVRARPAPLPTTFRPLADQIAGRQSVALSTDTASRRALRSVGKRAATVGGTIHLDASAQQLVAPSAQLTEVVAHELTHVAHPSAAPRFFDDIDESPEERRAEAVARSIRRAPVSPTNSTLSAPFAPPRPAPTRGPGGSDVIRRALIDTDVDTDSQPRGVAALAAMFGGQTPHLASPPGSLRSKESLVPTSSTAPTGTTPSTGGNGTSSPSTGATNPADVLDTDYARSWFQGEIERNNRLILERLEDTILAQLERRGGRFRGGF